MIVIFIRRAAHILIFTDYSEQIIDLIYLFIYGGLVE